MSLDRSKLFYCINLLDQSECFRPRPGVLGLADTAASDICSNISPGQPDLHPDLPCCYLTFYGMELTRLCSIRSKLPSATGNRGIHNVMVVHKIYHFTVKIQLRLNLFQATWHLAHNIQYMLCQCLCVIWPRPEQDWTINTRDERVILFNPVSI